MNDERRYVMENASKALLIAGAVLVAILIISLGVFVFGKFGGAAKEAANMDEQEVSAFNSKITPYVGNTIAGSQVNALLQYCLSSNMSAHKNGETYKYLTVYVDGVLKLNEDNKAEETTYDRVTTGGTFYKVETEYDNEGLIRKIWITPKH